MRGRTDAASGTQRDERHDYWGVVVDAPDGLALARFYADLLGWQLTGDERWATVAPAECVAYLGFQTSAEYVPPTWPPSPGAQQQMLHLDFEVDDLESASEHAVELGATVADYQPQPNVRVHLDPAGHPFCLYVDD